MQHKISSLGSRSQRKHTWSQFNSGRKILVIILFVSNWLMGLIYFLHLLLKQQRLNSNTSPTLAHNPNNTNPSNTSPSLGHYHQTDDIDDFDNFDEKDNPPLFS